MIHIVTTSYDETVTEVMAWLKSYKVQVNRINTDLGTLSSIQFNINDFANPSTNCVWFRKIWQLNIQSKEFNDIGRHIHNELYHGLYFPLFYTAKFALGNIETSLTFNKPFMLARAKKIGLQIPTFILTNAKKDLLAFIEAQKEVVVKCASDVYPFYYNNKRFHQYVKKIDHVSVNKIPTEFEVSFFQAYIKGVCDIKAFYLNGNIYAAAIIKADANIVDYRSIGNSNDAILTPFDLPTELQEKVVELMKMYNLNIGTLDFVVNSEGVFYLVDLNPSGQFGMISKSCNYHLEKKVAEVLQHYA